jgi:hypothetical protein
MKYLKLFESNSDKLSKLIPELQIIYQELEDKNFKIDISETVCSIMDFGKKSIIHRKKYINDNIVDCITIMLSNKKSFNILDIKDDLLSAESYIKYELNMIINYIYIYDKIGSTYYKNIESIPDDLHVFRAFQICFIKL